VFLLPVSLILLAGIYDLWRRRSAIDVILLAGLVLAPVPAVLVDERYAVQRELFVLPFGVLVAVFGVSFLLRQRQLLVRLATVLLLLAMPIQYAYFHRDYFNGYRIRSASWFDPVNFRDVAEYLITNAASADTPAVYLSRELDDGAARWGFYLMKHGRQDLSQRTTYFSTHDLDLHGVPAGSLIVLYANDPKLDGLLGAEKCSIAKIVTDAAGGKSAVILRKNHLPRT
jgi:hypothetical protein